MLAALGLKLMEGKQQIPTEKKIWAENQIENDVSQNSKRYKHLNWRLKKKVISQ